MSMSPRTSAARSDVLERETVDVLLTDLRLGGEDGMTIDRARIENAAPAGLHHDDGLRFG